MSKPDAGRYTQIPLFGLAPVALVGANRDKNQVRSVAEAATDEVFHKYIETQIERVNEHLSRVETVKRFKILPRDFSVETPVSDDVFVYSVDRG